MSILEEFVQSLKDEGVDVSSKKYGEYPSTIKRWISCRFKPSYEAVIQFSSKRMENNVNTALKPPNLHHEWSGKNLNVLFPCYRFTNPGTAWALVAMALDYGKEKIYFDMEIGDAMIVNSRNKLATRFFGDWNGMELLVGR